MKSGNNAVIALYDTHAKAEAGVRLLKSSGFDMTKLSIVARNPHTEEHVVGFYNAGDRIKHWGTAGAFWGGMWGLLFGAAFFSVPGMGPVLVAGPLIAGIIGALEQAAVVGGLSAIGAGLFSIGIPKDSVLQYEMAIKVDKFVLLAQGTAADIAAARTILHGTEPAGLHLHSSQPAGVAG